MQVGDLVKYRTHDTNAALGIILRTPEQTKGLYAELEVCWLGPNFTHTMFCRRDFLEIVKC